MNILKHAYGISFFADTFKSFLIDVYNINTLQPKNLSELNSTLNIILENYYYQKLFGPNDIIFANKELKQYIKHKMQ